LTEDGAVHSGIVISETPEKITLRNSQGTDVVLNVDEIEDQRVLEKSAMPEDVVKDVPDEEMQSLLDYLKSIAVKPEPGGDVGVPANDQPDPKK